MMKTSDGGLAEGAVQTRVTLSRSIQPPGAGHTAPRGGLAQLETAASGLTQDAVRPMRKSWVTALRGEVERNAVCPAATPSASAAGGKLRCNGKRPACAHTLASRSSVECLRPDCRWYSSYAADVRTRLDGEAWFSRSVRSERNVVCARCRPRGSGPGLPCRFRFSPPGGCWRW